MTAGTNGPQNVLSCRNPTAQFPGSTSRTRHTRLEMNPGNQRSKDTSRPHQTRRENGTSIFTVSGISTRSLPVQQDHVSGTPWSDQDVLSRISPCARTVLDDEEGRRRHSLQLLALQSSHLDHVGQPAGRSVAFT